jgi:hypothetical protein
MIGGCSAHGRGQQALASSQYGSSQQSASAGSLQLGSSQGLCAWGGNGHGSCGKLQSAYEVSKTSGEQQVIGCLCISGNMSGSQWGSQKDISGQGKSQQKRSS